MDQNTSVSTEQIRDALIRTAGGNGSADLASIHLLLASGADLGIAVSLGYIELIERPDGLHASVCQWLNMIDYVRPGTQANMLRLARAYAASAGPLGGPVDLARAAVNLPPECARAVAEAALICGGLTGWFTIAPTNECPTVIRELVTDRSVLDHLGGKR